MFQACTSLERRWLHQSNVPENLLTHESQLALALNYSRSFWISHQQRKSDLKAANSITESGDEEAEA